VLAEEVANLILGGIERQVAEEGREGRNLRRLLGRSVLALVAVSAAVAVAVTATITVAAAAVTATIAVAVTTTVAVTIATAVTAAIAVAVTTTVSTAVAVAVTTTVSTTIAVAVTATVSTTIAVAATAVATIAARSRRRWVFVVVIGRVSPLLRCCTIDRTRSPPSHAHSLSENKTLGPKYLAGSSSIPKLVENSPQLILEPLSFFLPLAFFSVAGGEKRARGLDRT